MSRRRPRFPIVVAAIVVVAAVATSAAALSTRRPRLPATTPDRLIAATIRALNASPSLSGDVASHVDLGLPSISGFGDATDPTAIVSGDHSIRIWMSRDGVRVDDLLSMAQRSLYVSATDAWAWDSQTFTAYHLRGLEHSGPREPTGPVTPDPVEAARRALAAVDPTTAVGLAAPREVAGHAAYVLRLEPRTPQTLVGAIEIAIEAHRDLPLAVSVFARGANKPAISIGFTSVRFDAIDRSIYRFSPPAGATVKQTAVPAARSEATHRVRGSAPPTLTTIGSGFQTVYAIRTDAVPHGRNARPFRELLPYSGPLFSARIVERGDHAWIVAGFVPQSQLILIESQLQ